MSAVSISSIISSLIGFWQKIGVTTDSFPIKLPDDVLKFLNAAKELFAYLLSLIPSFPNFDTRGILVLTSFGLPLVIDFIFCWFMLRFYEAVLHIFDVICTILFFYCFGSVIFGETGLTITLIFIVSALYLAIRILVTFYLIVIKKKQKYTLEQMIHEVKHHFLRGVIPGIQSRTTFKTLNQHLHSYCSHIVLISKIPSIRVPYVFILVGIVLFIISLILTGIFGSIIPIPSQVKIFAPPFGYFFSICFIIAGVLKATKCGNKALLVIKKFAKRWGIRILMMFIEMLYIPIVTTLTNQIAIEKYTYNYGYYPKVHFNPNYQLDMFVSHNVTEELCNEMFYNQTLFDIINGSRKTNSFEDDFVYEDNYDYYYKQRKFMEGEEDEENPEEEEKPFNSTAENTKICNEKCGGYTYHAIVAEPQIEATELFVVLAPTIVYSVCVILIGVPAMWYVFIKTNKSIISVVEVYGDTLEEKWLNIVNRMRTTGIFLFYEYKENMSMWAVFDLVIRAIIIITSTIGAIYFVYFIFITPFIYIALAISIGIVRPYLYPANNYLDIILNVLNALYCIIPILAYAGIEMPAIFGWILCVLLIVIPVISLIYLLCKYTKGVSNNEDDPTVIIELSEDDIKDRDRRIAEGISKSQTEFLIASKPQNKQNPQQSSGRGMQAPSERPISLQESHGGKKTKSKQNLFYQDEMENFDSSNDEERDGDPFNEVEIEHVQYALPVKHKSNHRKDKKHKSSTPKEDEFYLPDKNTKDKQTSKGKNDVYVNDKKRMKYSHGIEEILDVDAYVYQNLPEDFVTVRKSQFLSIYDFLESQNSSQNPQDQHDRSEYRRQGDKKSKKNAEPPSPKKVRLAKRAYESSDSDEDLEDFQTRQNQNKKKAATRKRAGKAVKWQRDPAYAVNRHLLSRRFQAMYQVLDLIIDGHTIEKLNKAMTIAVLIGSATFGWYLSTTISYYNDNIKIACA